jgi:hypothetical protein
MKRAWAVKWSCAISDRHASLYGEHSLRYAIISGDAFDVIAWAM